MKRNTRVEPRPAPFHARLTVGLLALCLGSGACSDSTDATGGRGANVPWTEYQAEDGKTNATVLGPNRTRYDQAFIEAEAIGRKAVRLDKTGDYVAITAKTAANSIVVRLSIPDSPEGGGIDSTLGLYVNGQRVKTLEVTSRYSWVYGGEVLRTPNTPSAGEPHAFFDETRALVEPIPAGAEVKLQKDARDTAAFYVIDLIDLEQVAAPLEKPADLVSVTEYGALPDDNVDDGEAIQNAIDAAVGEGKKGLWIPRGTYLVNEVKQGQLGLSLKGIEIRGAGMWYTQLKGAKATFYCWGEGGCRFSDFSILGEADFRDDDIPNNGFNGGVGKNTRIENVWVEHVKVGFWCGTDADPHGTDGLVVRHSRFRNLYADGINLANGTRNSVVEHCHFRNTGDDAMAMWSNKQAGDPASHDNVYRYNTVQMPWRANCFAIYGGYNNTIEKSVCEDVLTYSGILIDNEFDAHPFAPTTTLEDISLIRAGGAMFGGNHGALRFYTRQGPVNDITAKNIDIIDSTFAGIQFQNHPDSQDSTFSNILLENVFVTGSRTYGIEVIDEAGGRASFEDVVVKDSGKGALHAPGVPGSFFDRRSGNMGW
ncbi:glycosyl hydrolase family 28-related protein [Cystobacter fuscus]